MNFISMADGDLVVPPAVVEQYRRQASRANVHFFHCSQFRASMLLGARLAEALVNGSQAHDAFGVKCQA